jgi:hypothetical protein
MMAAPPAARPLSIPDAYTTTARHPSSIAPFALDVASPPARRSQLESTSEIYRAAGLPQRPIWQTAVGIAGAAVLSALALGSVAFGVSSSRTKNADATLAASNVQTESTTPTRVASVIRDDRQEQSAASLPAAETNAPPANVVAPAQESVQEIDESPAPVVTQIGHTEEAPPAPAPKAVAVAPVAAPVAPRVVAPAPKIAAAAPASPAPAVTAKSAAKKGAQTGELHLPAVNGALVDGAPRRVTGGVLVLACGNHKIKVPNQSARVVNVPCGGSTSF